MPKDQRLWVVDQAVAYVENGAVTIQIDRPTRHLRRKQAFEVADKVWFANQMKELEIARQRGETKEIPLTDRRRRSSLRLGGGFVITQGTKLVVVRRHPDAPRPGQFCECGGVFEVRPEDREKDPADLRNDFVASLLRESQEIVLTRLDTLYIPQLPPSPSIPIGFQPPGTLDTYNSIIEDEVTAQVEEAKIPVSLNKIRRFWVKMLDYEQAVRLQFGYSPELSVEITAEVDTSSLECVGILSYPEDIDAAVIAFLEERLAELKKDLKEAKSESAAELQRKIKEINEELKRAKEKEGGEFEYWDAEMMPNPNEKERKDTPEVPVDRDIHLIDIETGDDIVWYLSESKRERCSRRSSLWKELSATRLGKTEGRFATEKLEKAIKMHCPFPRLQPLARL